MGMTWLVGLLALLLLAGVAALLLSRRAWADAGLPAGRVVYADTGDWRPPERPLFSRQHRLSGRPDYLVETGGEIIPVEVKSGTAPPQPYPAHVLQLAAYCLLAEEHSGQAPSHGLVKYADRVFAVDYTPALRAELLATIEAMRRDLRSGNVRRSHDAPARCRSCGYRDDCDERLA
jgi:CRISPR-associated exonuclease Cas4